MAKEIERGEQLARPFFSSAPAPSRTLPLALAQSRVVGAVGLWRPSARAWATGAVARWPLAPSLLYLGCYSGTWCARAISIKPIQTTATNAAPWLLLGACCYALGGAALYGISVPPLMLVTAASCVVNTLLVWWINRSYKISIHAAGVRRGDLHIVDQRRQCGVALFAKLAGRRLGAALLAGAYSHATRRGRCAGRWEYGTTIQCFHVVSTAHEPIV